MAAANAFGGRARSAASGAADGRSLEREVRDALTHLHDPGHLQRHPLTRYLQTDSASASLGRALRQALLDAIDSLKPSAQTSPTSPAGRTYAVLKLRYSDAIEVPQILDRLALSKTVYYSAQLKAVEAVASVLAERWGLGGMAGPPAEAHGEPEGERLQTTVPNNLPTQLTSFVGREQEMAEVERLLGTTRLLTLTGTGGCGKTRLAYQVAERILTEHPGRHPDGIWVVELAALSDRSLVPKAVASTLGLLEQPGQPIVEVLATFLRPKRLLLVIDNCEHLLDACAELAESLLLACPQVHVLATSREMLRASGEVSWRVPSLDTPDPSGLPPFEELADYEAVRLFSERARLVQPRFEVKEQNATAVAEVVTRLDGIPLAIELAAALTRGLTVEQIADRLGDHLNLLTGGRRTALRRQQTLRATIDWSYDLLSEPEKVLFRRLAVFVGGWTLEAAEEVCQGGSDEARIEQGEVLDLLLRLVDRSLVVAEEVAGEERYHLLETIRQYAQEKLADSDETPTVRDRHKEWCLALARRAEPLLLGPDSVRWLDRLEVEHDNLRAALAWCVEHDVESGLDIIGCLNDFWDRHCHFQEGSRWATELLSKSLAETLPRARALITASAMAAGETDWARAAVLAEESLALCRRLGDRLALGRSTFALAHALPPDSAAPRMERLFREALEISRDIGDHVTLSDALWGLAGLASRQGGRDRAKRLLEESLAIARERGYKHGIAYRLLSLANLELPNGDASRSQGLAAEALSLFQSERFEWGIVSVLITLGYLALLEGRREEASRLATESLLRTQRLGTGFYADCLGISAAIAANSGAPERGARLLGSMEVERQRTGSMLWWSPSIFDATLASVLSGLGEEGFARAWAEGQAMTLEQAVDYALEGDSLH